MSPVLVSLLVPLPAEAGGQLLPILRKRVGAILQPPGLSAELLRVLVGLRKFLPGWVLVGHQSWLGGGFCAF